MPITPIGIETFEIINPLGLFHFSRILFVGSLSLIMLLTELMMSNIFLSFRINLLIKLSLSFFDKQF